MITIAFSCRRCRTRFKVPDSLAGKKARCKKCGQSLQVPQAPAVVASAAETGLFRMGAVEPDQPPSPRAPQPESKSHGWSAAPASLRLAPIPSLDDLKPVAKRERLWEDDDGVEYELEKPVNVPVAKAAPQLAQTRGRLFWGRGGVAEVLLIASRKISDYAYLVSIPFLLLMLLAIVLKQRELAVFAAVVVILLNIVRLGIDGFALITLAFKKGPVHGVLFFIPPFTFYYLSQRGKVMKEALGRFLGPALPIIGVLLLFIFVPWLRGGEEKAIDMSIRDRLQNDLRGVRENIKTRIDTPQDSKN
jgi:predicted Zn finger-like uncharacterized protein